MALPEDQLPSDIPTSIPIDISPTSTPALNLTTFNNSAPIALLHESFTGCYSNGSIPILLAKNDTCNLGFFCPNSTNESPPQQCPPSQKCMATRLTKAQCLPQGVLEPVVCKPGYYCPPGGKKQIRCDKGKFCPMGSYQQWDCSRGAICPAESQRQIVTVPFGVMIAFDVILGIIVGVGFAISAFRKKRKKHYTAVVNPTDEKDMDGDDIELISKEEAVAAPKGDVDEDLASNPDFKLFIQYINKLIKTKEVGLSFDFEDLQFEVKGGKKILHSVSGSIQSGSMWAIMGGSGAGKSTFGTSTGAQGVYLLTFANRNSY